METRWEIFERVYAQGITTFFEFKGENMPLSITTETKATLNAAHGRVLAWHNDKEPAQISIAVPGDRAGMSPLDARVLAAWLIKMADTIDAGRVDRFTVGRPSMQQYPR